MKFWTTNENFQIQLKFAGKSKFHIDSEYVTHVKIEKKNI